MVLLLVGPVAADVREVREVDHLQLHGAQQLLVYTAYSTYIVRIQYMVYSIWYIVCSIVT